jgi:hypothetical protein
VYYSDGLREPADEEAGPGQEKNPAMSPKADGFSL